MNQETIVFTNAIVLLLPGVNFSNPDNTLANLRIDTPNVAAPTQDQVNTAINVIQAQISFNVAISSGVTITSNSANSINGTYPIDQNSLLLLEGQQTSILTSNTFTNGQNTRTWLDSSNFPHIFPSTMVFTAFAIAVANYVDALHQAVILSVQTGQPYIAPPQPDPLT
jgi:hypothetical protein